MIKHYGTLLGKSSSGKVKEWDIKVVGGVDNKHCEGAAIVVEHGYRDGKKQVSVEKVTKGKNEGKANETTPFEQACSQALSMWNKKKDKGYALSIEELDAKKPTLPMLAQKYNKSKHRLVWPVFVQPKFNGVRCLVRREGDTIKFMTRGNKTYNTMKHLIPYFLDLIPEGGPDYDGELYNHKEISFQKLISLVKNEESPNWDEIERYIKFYNYDVALPVGFKERRSKFLQSKYIISVPTYVAYNEEEVLKYHKIFVDDGYEGTIVRSGGEEGYTYEYRVPHLLKLKDFEDDEFQIVGCREGVGKDEGTAIFRCKTEYDTGGSNGDGTFDVRCEGPYELRREQWINRDNYIGKLLTVRYKEVSEEGIPQHVVGMEIRDYE